MRGWTCWPEMIARLDERKGRLLRKRYRTRRGCLGLESDRIEGRGKRMQEEQMKDGELLIHRSEVNKEYWLERNWSWLVIGFGAVFIAWLDSWKPTW